MAKRYRNRTSGNKVGMKARGFGLALLASTPIYTAPAVLWPALAQQASVVGYSIPAGSLGGTISRFGDRSNLQVLYPADLVRGKRSPGVSGSLTREEALGRLLAGTGLIWRLTNANTVTIFDPRSSGGGAVAPAGSVVLDTIEVQGAGQFGPVNGFVSRDAVAGSKTDTPIIETPYSVSVVNRRQLDVQAPQSLQDALRYVPGIATGFFGADNRTTRAQFSLRGFNEDPNALFWNGLSLPSDSYVNSPSLEPYNLERIEVLRGPASVLYGQSGPGGIVNARSKRPTETPLREVVIGTGNFGRAYGAFDLGGPIDPEGHWLYRVSGVAYHTGAQIEDRAYERVSIAPSLTWRPSADTRFTILTSHQRDPDGVGFQSLPLVGTLLPSRSGRIPTKLNFGDPTYDRLDRQQTSVGYEFEHRFNDVWTVRQNARYLHADGSYREIQPSSTWANAANTIMNRSNWATEGQLNSVAIDTQAEARLETGPLKHTVLFGLDHKSQWTRLQHYWARTGVPALDITNPLYGYAFASPPMIANTQGQLTQTGLYAQDQIAFGNWRFLIGGRQDWAETSSTNLATTINPTTKQRDEAFTWRTGAVYLFDNGLAPYVSYATSFQPQGGTDFGGALFKPTTARQYEAGVKYQPPGLKSFVQASVFDLRQQDVLTTDPLHTGFSVQTGEVRVRGLELSATLALADNFNLVASYTRNEIETTKANLDATGFDPTGRVPWYYPKQLASLWADYTFESGPAAGLRLGAGVRYVGSAYNGPRQLYTVPDYAVVDAAINYDLGKSPLALRGWEVGVNATNLFDKDYLARCSELNCSYGIRRTVLANLKYKW